MNLIKSCLPFDLQNARIHVALENFTVIVGSSLKGYASIEVSEPMKCNDITIECVGKIDTSLDTFDILDQRHHSQRSIPEEKYILYKFWFIGAQFPTGQAILEIHRIPFNFDIPTNSPSSVAFTYWHFDNHNLSITHLIRVSVGVQNLRYLVLAVPFQVLGQPLHPVSSTLTEDTQEVNAFRLFNKGKIILGAHMSNSPILQLKTVKSRWRSITKVVNQSKMCKYHLSPKWSFRRHIVAMVIIIPTFNYPAVQ